MGFLYLCQANATAVITGAAIGCKEQLQNMPMIVATGGEDTLLRLSQCRLPDTQDYSDDRSLIKGSFCRRPWPP